MRSGANAEANYDRLSRWYDLLTFFGERKATGAALRALDVSGKERVLEIGFGTGRAIVAIAHSAGAEGEVQGIDISRGMIDVTRKRLEKAGLGGRVILQKGDARQLPYQDNHFDAVFMSFTLELFETPGIRDVLLECLRTLRPEGRICVASLSNQGRRGPVYRSYEWSHRRFPSIVDCRPIHLRQFLGEAGFQALDSKMMSIWRLPVEIALGSKPACLPPAAKVSTCQG